MNFLIQAARAPKVIAKIIAKAPYNKGDSFENVNVNSAKIFKSLFANWFFTISFEKNKEI